MVVMRDKVLPDSLKSLVNAFYNWASKSSVPLQTGNANQC